ncbi:MAG: TlpA family protein disulfide reductase [Candidatus Acidiferrales bacterium]
MWNKAVRVIDWIISLGSLVLLAYIALAIVPHTGNFRLPPRPTALRSGQPVPISGVDWSKARHTLVLALQIGCHFCADSAPFYKGLLKEQTGGWQAVAVLPQRVEQSNAYMRAEGYSISQVRQMDLGAIGVSGTPTLLLVDQKGNLEKEWVGELQPSGENEVATALGISKLARREPQVMLAGIGLESLASLEGSRSSSITRSQSPAEPPVGTKRVTFGPEKTAPVRIVQVLEGTTDVTGEGRDPATGLPYKPWTGKPFQAADDWVSGLVLVLKNASKKQVTAAEIDLIFPQTGAGVPGDPVAGYLLMIGRKPDHALYNPRTGRKHTPTGAETQSFSIMPGQEARIALAPFYDAIKANVEQKQPMSTVRICEIAHAVFYFADETRWEGGIFEKPVPNVPGEYMKMTPHEWNQTTPTN